MGENIHKNINFRPLSLYFSTFCSSCSGSSYTTKNRIWDHFNHYFPFLAQLWFDDEIKFFTNSRLTTKRSPAFWGYVPFGKQRRCFSLPTPLFHRFNAVVLITLRWGSKRLNTKVPKDTHYPGAIASIKFIAIVSPVRLSWRVWPGFIWNTATWEFFTN